jgi:hypothetical protein
VTIDMAAAPPTAIRLQLKAAGFSPLPLNGKKPSSVEGWQNKHGATAEEIRLWEKLYPYDHNTGLLTRLVPTIDIDIMHPEAAEAIEALAREHFEEHGDILVRIGKAPKRAIMLRTDEPFSKLTRGFAWPNEAARSRFWQTASRSSRSVYIPTPSNHITGTAESQARSTVRTFPTCARGTSRNF